MLRTLLLVIMVLAVLSGLFVAYAEGVLSVFTVWNLVPVAAVAMGGWFLLRREDRLRHLWWPYVAASVIVIAIVVLAHAAWLFDYQGTQTGSSTAGLMFIFLPLLSMAAGTVVFGVMWALGAAGRRLRGTA